MSVPADRSLPRVEGRAPNRASLHRSASSSETAAAERLTDDMLLEILSRVPAKSLCRFRCVSKHWLGLIDHPDHRKRLPQTLAGFFYSSTCVVLDGKAMLKSPLLLTSVSGSPCPLTSTSLAFLPSHMRLYVMDCCNGLFLCGSYVVSTRMNKFSYIVCNPATEKWVALPDSGQAAPNWNVRMARLGFDPAKSPHFHVFELLEQPASWDHHGLGGVAVYSSETGGWIYKEERWNQYIVLPFPNRSTMETVFSNSRLYFHAFGTGYSKCLAAVDTEGETWTDFGVPRDGGLVDGFIQWSQGRLHYANFYTDEDNDVAQLAVYVLENYESKEWILKHVAAPSDLFGGTDVNLEWDFLWVGIHPECNLIFFTAGLGTTFMCYSMDHRQVKVIRSHKDVEPPYLPYVPLYAELQSLHM